MVTPTNGMIIIHDTILEPGVYFLPDGISIATDGVTLDGNGAHIIGSGRTGRGVSVAGHDDVTIRNLNVQSYRHGIYAERCQRLTVEACRVRDSAELPPNSEFLDIWRPVERSYGSGILLHQVEDSRVVSNDLQHQMNGLLTYSCQHLLVEGNVANYCSGFGFHFSDSHHNLVLDNSADFCCRYQARGIGGGHLGADSAGFLLVRGSSRNVLQRNSARLGGDGFFLAGLTPDGEHLGCNDNLFEHNDGSYSPNNAFEATFCDGNVFWSNRANHSNYGFWLGFSANCVVESNQMDGNRQAGLAVENGFGFVVRDNVIAGNGHGILMWSRYVPRFISRLPRHNTCYDWLIESNELNGNGKAIRVAANQDHGTRPLNGAPAVAPHPHDYTIRNNQLRRNTINFDMSNDKMVMAENKLAA